MPFVKNWRNEYNFSLDVNGKSEEERKGGWIYILIVDVDVDFGVCGMQVTNET